MWLYIYCVWFKVWYSLWFPSPDDDIRALRECHNKHGIRLDRIEQELSGRT